MYNALKKREIKFYNMADFFSNGYGSGLIGGALGMIGGAIQYKRQKKLMAQQYGYALGMAQRQTNCLV